MRAAAGNIHVSGSERILYEPDVEKVLGELICRALSSYTQPDEIIISVDEIEPRSITYIQSLDVKTVESDSCLSAEETATQILESDGISPELIKKVFNILRGGTAAEGNNMRGAIIMDASSGNRIEPDISRGIRVSRIDYTEEARGLLEKELHRYGIYHTRVIEALAIASKVCRRAETIAELCWSDNPDYTTGYVASATNGYIRITNMKEKGSPRGGRVLFVNTAGLSLDDYINYLERQPVLINKIGNIHAP